MTGHRPEQPARRPISRRRVLGGSLAALGVLLAACRGTGDTPDTATEAPAAAALTPTPPPPTPNISATATVIAQLQSIRMPTTEPPTLDPALATDHSSVQVAIQLFEGLTEIDEAGQTAPLGAERWEVGDDGRTYTFFLRGDRLWSDGTPVTADDYVWAWRRAIDPRTAADYATLLYPIKNAARIHGQRLDSALLGATARETRTLVVNLEEPLAHFPRLTSLVTFSPLKKEALERHGDRWIRPENIVTNGPFRLIEWQHDRQIVLGRNPTYPNADRLMPRATYRIFPDDGAAAVLAAYESGALDVFGTGASFEVPPTDAERILAGFPRALDGARPEGVGAGAAEGMPEGDRETQVRTGRIVIAERQRVVGTRPFERDRPHGEPVATRRPSLPFAFHPSGPSCVAGESSRTTR